MQHVITDEQRSSLREAERLVKNLRAAVEELEKQIEVCSTVPRPWYFEKLEDLIDAWSYKEF